MSDFLRDPTGDHDLRLGTMVADRYRVLARIGKGGMGAVYEAEHVVTKKHVAVKMLLPGLGKLGDIARRFEREAKAASLLSHANVVQVTDFGTLADGSLYLVMELVRGTSLGDVLEDGRLEPLRALALTRQVLSALAHAHAVGVIHRDLKPDNVMLVDDGDGGGESAKLLDFGIAKVVGAAEEEVGGDKLTQAGVTFGTPDYMSPEQALGEEVDGRADLYAMGVLLFQMLCGRKPFRNDDKIVVLRMHLAAPPPSLAEASGQAFPAELEALVARALAKRRQERYASAADMILALDRAVATLATGTAATLAMARATTPNGLPAPPSWPSAPARRFAFPRIPRLPRLPRLPGLPGLSRLSHLARVGRLPRAVLIGAPIVLLVIALVAVLSRGGGGPGGPAHLGALVPTVLTPVPPRSALAKRAAALLASGDAEGAAAALEPALVRGDGAKDAWAHLLLGHARSRLAREVEALAAYERAVALAAALTTDETMRNNVAAMLGEKDKRVALAALEFLGSRVGAPARALILEQASRGKVKELRHRAQAIAEREGFADEIDRVDSWSLDLQQLASCRERREMVLKLRALGDKRAIPALKKAKNRSGGFLNLQDVNDCLERDAAEAIASLETQP